MKKRLILLTGLGVGFILGSRTGRQSYERLKAQAQDLWTDPRVQDTVEKANQSIREKSPAVADAVQTAADKVNAAAATSSPVSEFDGDEDSAGAKASGGAAVHVPSPKAKDTVADPERHLDDEGPAGVADDD
ncbi:hypothetical protein SAMN04489752_0783 [Brevibacterium siliguriense]|uniref:YtxH domain-containing protein n=1 Tax=Brevibacterium siliguriense TaxID=1136497 RepID=A0A1H1NP56_9MICO|nr:hypothetical protein [Brevibacterium siliguriense]SDS00821.1 hypothetical protein SAMN04489752_0783 [Brevibacterium siliguriense]